MATDLAARLVAASELHGDFVLSSGKRSSVYFDKFRFLSDPKLLAELVDEARARIPTEVTHLAAPEGAATLLLGPLGLATGLPMVVVRKEPKAYGTRSQVEGQVATGAPVALLEDVSTTGHQVARAARVLEAEGMRVALILLVIDRGGADPLRSQGFTVDAIVSLRPEEHAGGGA